MGVWVSKGSLNTRWTLLFRPDGTGRIRAKNSDVLNEGAISWSYAGQGLWQASKDTRSGLGGGFLARFEMNIRRASGEMLLEWRTPEASGRQVCVRAGDESAVDAHLNAR